jgi:hypothetical protein
MPRRWSLLLVLPLSLGLVGLAACGPGGGTPPVEAAPPPSAIDASAVSGRYEVRGVTVQAQSGRQREIAGTLELEVTDLRYEVRFDLGTTAPDLPGSVPVGVRGSGRGIVVGDILAGTTEEWMALVPPEGGLDAVALRGTALPRRAGRKIVSASRASFESDGSFEIVLQNYPAPGEDYEASMTVLAGTRIDAAGAP